MAIGLGLIAAFLAFIWAMCWYGYRTAPRVPETAYMEQSETALIEQCDARSVCHELDGIAAMVERREREMMRRDEG